MLGLWLNITTHKMILLPYLLFFFYVHNVISLLIIVFFRLPCPLRGKGLGESGGALFKGKEGRGDFRKTSFERRPVQSDTAMRNKNNFFQNLIGVTTCNIVGTLY